MPHYAHDMSGPEGSRPPAQSGQTRCTNADDLVMEDFGEDF